MLVAVLLSWHRPSHHCSIGLARMAGAQDLITLIHFFSPWYISTELQSDFSSAHCYLVALVWGISFRSLYSFTRYIAKIIVWYVRLIWVPHLFYIISRSLHPSYHVIFHPQHAAGCPWTFMMLWTQCSHTYATPMPFPAPICPDLKIKSSLLYRDCRSSEIADYSVHRDLGPSEYH